MDGSYGRIKINILSNNKSFSNHNTTLLKRFKHVSAQSKTDENFSNAFWVSWMKRFSQRENWEQDFLQKRAC